MGWVTKEQIAKAREIPAIDYVLKHEPNNIKRIGKEYRFLDHESLSIGNNGWYWHSRGTGGFSALSYLTEVRGIEFVEAVCMLINEKPYDCSGNIKTDITPKGDFQNTKSKTVRQPFELPPRNANNKRVIAYLLSRGIDRDLIMDCINRGDLYESHAYHSCVFLGKDNEGNARSAFIRSTSTGFIGDSIGSDKRYGFIIPPENEKTNEVAVFESAIDALSHQTLCKQGHIPYFGGWRLSLGCSSTIALEQFIKQHPETGHCVICTDVDEAGKKAAIKIADLTGITTEHVLPIHNQKDWNDALNKVQRIEHDKNTARQKDDSCR